MEKEKKKKLVAVYVMFRCNGAITQTFHCYALSQSRETLTLVSAVTSSSTFCDVN